MRLVRSGSFGIGMTPSDSYKLDVTGAVRFSSTLNVGSDLGIGAAGVGNLWVGNNCSALSFTDRTLYYDGDALAALSQVRGDRYHRIDHDSLPSFARKRIVHENGQVEEARDLGAMISIHTKAIQQLMARLAVLEAQ